MEITSFDADEAASEAAARATRANARKDPELAQAARALARKERKKAQAKEASPGENVAGGTATGSGRAPSGGAKKRQAGARGPLPNRQRPAQQSGRKPAATGGRKPGAPGGAKGKAGTAAKTGAPARGQAKASGGAKPQGTGARGSKQGTPHVNGGAPKRSGADLRPGRAHRAAVAKQRRPR